MSELMLDPRQEIFEIIDKDSHKYLHCNPYVQWDDKGQINGCCINGLVMLHHGWNPDRAEWLKADTMLPDSWQEMALFIAKRYGDGTLGDVNTVNQDCQTWSECKQRLKDYWRLP